MVEDNIARRLYVTTAAAAVAYASAGIYWWSGGRGFPYGTENDPLAHHSSILENLTRAEGAPWVVGCSLVGAALALGMARGPATRIVRSSLALASIVYGVALTLVLPDGRPLIAAAHIPVLLLGKPFGWPEDVTIASQVSWPLLNQLLLMGIGVLFTMCAVVHHRRTHGACTRCGRRALEPSWKQPDRALVWGRSAAYVAMAVPAFYAVFRLAWALDIPLGVSRQFLETERADSPSIFVAGALMALLALTGACLTLGLVQKWGEVYPRWIPVLAGRTVRPRTAIAPATAVAFLMTGSGVGWYRAAINGWFPEGAMGRDWGTIAPGAVMWLWGVALAVATYSYYLRRRGVCTQCGLDGPSHTPVDISRDQPVLSAQQGWSSR